MRFTVIAALTMSCLSATALAADDGSAKHAKKPDDPNRKLCRDMGSTGSHMVSRVCRTKAEWDAIATRDAAATSDALAASRGTVANPGATRAN